MSLQKLIWTELAVTDLDEALGFDVEVMGLTEVARDSGKVYLSCDIEDPHAQLILTEGGTGVRSFALGVDNSTRPTKRYSRSTSRARFSWSTPRSTS